MDTTNQVDVQPATVWMTRLQVMDYLKIGSAHTLAKRIRQDGLPVHKLGNEQRFDRAEVDAWLRSRCIANDAGERGAA